MRWAWCTDGAETVTEAAPCGHSGWMSALPSTVLPVAAGLSALPPLPIFRAPTKGAGPPSQAQDVLHPSLGEPRHSGFLTRLWCSVIKSGSSMEAGVTLLFGNSRCRDLLL
ncbi:unnamed protein product [Rangifer tarandus platyrhynchus]|uniref:Uncharacterized protein n=2 Tax=Rangifer tarandus platyrhynchus TaxID=3082113 RepID=A0ACB0EZW0_RANTA|nr:unnamed protein product [Rangifer tarandus platyrhynchus]CAI9705999.1 unnamed protein product [Rangifer tarandus platyrhynchus]